MKKKLLIPVFIMLLGSVLYGKQLLSSTAIATASVSKEATVLICNSSSSYAYHSHKCSGLNRCTHSILKLTSSEASRKGYKPCKICYK